MRKLLLALLALVCSWHVAYAATLLPNGKQQFFGLNGAPLVNGLVYFYIPGTSSPKNTWQDSGNTILNTNPVQLDSLASAIVYGSGCYRQVVFDSLGNLIWDQLTCDTSGANQLQWGGTSGGTANAQTVLAPNFSATDGQEISFYAGLSNTGPMTLTPSGTGGAITVVKDTPSGNQTLAQGDVIAGNIYTVTYSATTGSFHTTIIPAAVPAGVVADYFGTTPPGGWLLANGQCVSQTIYAQLFSVIGLGSGCSAGQFQVPDLRGRVLAGRDNMANGTNAGRLSGTYFTPANDDTLSAVGGAQTQTLLTANLPPYTPAGSVGTTLNSLPAASDSLLNTVTTVVSSLPGGSGFNVITAASTPSFGTPTASSTFTGTAQGGTSTAVLTMQPTILSNKIIKY